MSRRLGILSGLALVSAATVSLAQGAVRSTQTDSRWYPFLGCWASDTTGGHAAHAGATCLVPMSGGAGVEALSLVNGKVISRRRIDATGRSQPIDNQGCAGSQLATWSATGHRVYMRADYTCNTGIAGTSESMFALAPNGEMLRIEDVRAGSGGSGVVNVDRRRDVGIPLGLPAEAAAMIESRQLSIETSRAAAARPLTTDDVVEALHNVDAPVVRNWIYESGQRFDLSGQQINALAKADVPATVLQAMMGNAPAQQMAYSDTMGAVPVYRGSVVNTAPYQVQTYQPETYQPVTTQPAYTQYPYSEYDAYSWNGFYYPIPLYYPYYYYPVPTYQRPLRYGPTYTAPRPFVAVHSPAAGGFPHSAPYHPSGEPTQPVNRTPSRHRP